MTNHDADALIAELVRALRELRPLAVIAQEQPDCHANLQALAALARADEYLKGKTDG